MKAKFAKNEEGQRWLIFWCEGCHQRHAVPIDGKNHNGAGPWGFNENLESPTLTPSVNYVGSCHFHLINGQIQYQMDCTHELAGKTVELTDLPNEN